MYIMLTGFKVSVFPWRWQPNHSDAEKYSLDEHSSTRIWGNLIHLAKFLNQRTLVRSFFEYQGGPEWRVSLFPLIEYGILGEKGVT